MSDIGVNVQINTAGLSQGIAAASVYSKRTLPQIINTSAYWISVNAKSGLPYVTPEKIDQELAVITSPVIGKRGKALKNKKRYSGGIAPSQRVEGVPLAVLIVQARSNPNSAYNVLTNQRYALASSPFKGRSRAAGRAAMAAFEDKMIKVRHRSGKFLVAGWIEPIRTLGRFAVQKFIRGSAAPLDGQKSFYGSSLGSAKPAVAGAYTAFAVIENSVGTQGKNAASFNRALLLYGVPATQAAVDREGKKNAEYALKKFEEELKREVDPHWK